MRGGFFALALVAPVFFLGTGSASAAVAASFDGTTLVLTGTAADESVTLTGTAGAITVTSPQGVAGACQEATPCAVNVNATVRADLGGGADAFDAAALARNLFVAAVDGSDTVRSGSGADTIILQGAGNDVWAGAGGDIVSGGEGTLRGEDGADFLSGDGRLDGGPGDDRLEGIFIVETLDGGPGRDSVQFTRTGNVSISLDGQPNDGVGATARANVVDAEVLIGGASADTLTGDDGAQELRGGGGSDTLLGLGGDDLLLGGDGADELSGGIGADRLEGGDNDDDLSGGNEDDVLLGGAGADVVGGGPGVDRLEGEAGGDALDGGDDDDTLMGGAGADSLLGGAGDDALDAVDGEVDELDCGAGDDRAAVDAVDVVTGCEPVAQDPPIKDPPVQDPPMVLGSGPQPGGSDSAPPARVAVADLAAPVVGLTVGPRVRASRGVAASVKCSEACSVKVELRLSAKVAKRWKLPRVLALGTGRLSQPGTVRMTVKPGKAVRRKLQRVKGTVKATLATTATDGAGNARTVSRTVKLSR